MKVTQSWVHGLVVTIWVGKCYRDNVIMQHNIAKHGFSYCGIIYLASGDERLAYQKLRFNINK